MNRRLSMAKQSWFLYTHFLLDHNNMNILNHNKSKPKTSQTPRAKSLTKSFERVSPPKIKHDNKTLVESLKMFEVPHLTTLN